MSAAKLPRAFLWLNVTQFLGALNDNVFKLLLIIVLIDVMGPDARASVVGNISAIFVLPFLLFANLAGVLADRYSKGRLILATKAFGVLVMTAGVAAVQSRHPPALYAVLFLLCTQSAFFGPSKFGIIPELVPPERLSHANGLIVGLTYIAIIIGTFLPSAVLDKLGFAPIGVAFLCLAFAVAELITARLIGRTPRAGGTKRASILFFVEIFKTLRGVAPDRYLLLTIFGAAYFLLLGGFIQQNVLLYGQVHLHLDAVRSGYLFPLSALGIAGGGLLAGRISGRNIEFGIVPVGALGLAIACILMGLLPASLGNICTLTLLSGFFAGLFIVPLDAFIQFRSPSAQRGEIMAAQSFLSFLGVAISAVLVLVLQKHLGLSPKSCFLFVGVLTLILALVAGRVLPDFLVRFVAVVITRCLYRVRMTGIAHIPMEGGALLVSNHVTWADAVLLSTLTNRRIRFVMLREIMEKHALGPIFRLMHAIPISPHDPPRRVVESLQQARAALDDGYLVCVFAEGALTRNGNLRPFRAGLERILKGSTYPIIPIYIGGAWGSILSYYAGRLLATLPQVLPYPVWIAVGGPMPAATSSAAVRQAISELACTTYDMRKRPERNLAQAFVRSARRNWRRPAMADTTGRRLTFGRTLAGAIAASRALEPHLRGQPHVGVLLPSTVAGALTNLAITLTGRVAVNLNFTASRESIRHAIAQADLRTIISSRAFLEKLEGFEIPPGTLYIEDVVATIGGLDRLRAMAAAHFVPATAFMTHRRPGPDDLATIIFSSGSTGQPKGVMLSHHNLMSNVDAFGAIFGFEHHDKICCILPIFHSFGYTVTFWCPMLLGFNVHFHPNPMDTVKIAEIVRVEKLTVLLTTPTFLLAYLRRATREDFASLRAVVTGAEKLKDKLADAFEEHFGIRPLEGYGATELAPVASVNLPDADIAGTRQPGTKSGSVGHPLPGVSIRIVDPETGAMLPIGATGLVLVHGPNVMQGYLGEPEMTAAALRDGWYCTGDVGRVDEDGFLFLVDRLARFSKIGGEMVPHVAIEEQLQSALGTVQAVVAVTSAPDERKGEQLVVLYTDGAGDAATLQRTMKTLELPNLWKPRDDNYVRVDSLPALGSGKLDLRRVKEIARAHVEQREHT